MLNTRLYAWGSGVSGQLGNGGVEDSSLPVLVRGDPASSSDAYVRVFAGTSHCVALTAEKRCVSWGQNDCGQLGIGGTTNRAEPVCVDTSPIAEGDLRSCSAGWAHTLSVTDRGVAVGWGSSAYGQLGWPSGRARDEPTSAHYYDRPISLSRILGPVVVVDVACGVRHSAFVGADGSLFTLGWNKFGQLGTGDVLAPTVSSIPTCVFGFSKERVEKVACGYKHTMCCTDAGRIFAWGDNTYGAVGVAVKPTPISCSHPRGSRRLKGRTTRAIVPTPVLVVLGEIGRSVQCGWSFSLVMTASGSVYTFGRNNYGQLGRSVEGDADCTPGRVELEPAKQVSCGSEHTLALTDGGEVFAWGWNEHGNLGVGDFTNRPSPEVLPFFADKMVAWVNCGGGHSLAIVEENGGV